MRVVSFSELADIDICLSEILCVEQHWKDKHQSEYINGRDQNILSLSVCGKKQLFTRAGDIPLLECDGTSVFFISAGNPYISRVLADKEHSGGNTICVKFKITDSMGEDILIKDKYLCWRVNDDDNYLHLFRKLINAYMMPKVNNLSIKGTLYRILNELCKSVELRGNYEDDFQDLAPALKYLATDLGNNLSITEIAQLCFMSASYFHKRFKTYSGGETFVEYRNKLRVEKARELLENPMWSISMVSQSLGFYDLSHFYRVYKKYTGELPVHIKKVKKPQP